MLETLKKFCHDGPCVLQLNDPFSIGDFTYATDGRLAIRFPKLEAVGIVEGAPKNMVKLWDEVWGIPVPAWESASMDGVTLSYEPCDYCGGKGYYGLKRNKNICDECDGEKRLPKHDEDSQKYIGKNLIDGWMLKRILDSFPDAVFDVQDRGLRGIPWKVSDQLCGILMPLRKAPTPPQAKGPRTEGKGT